MRPAAGTALAVPLRHAPVTGRPSNGQRTPTVRLSPLALLVLLALPLPAAAAGDEAGMSTAHTLRLPGCVPPRDAHGHIARSRSVLQAWKHRNPCPSTGLTKGSCPGFDVSHSWPLFCCGPDEAANLSWLPHAVHVEFHRDLQSCSSAVPSP
jgi:hypothetical protein